MLAQIEPTGLTYAYTTHNNQDGYVVFVPWQTLQHQLGITEKLHPGRPTGRGSSPSGSYDQR